MGRAHARHGKPDRFEVSMPQCLHITDAFLPHRAMVMFRGKFGAQIQVMARKIGLIQKTRQGIHGVKGSSQALRRTLRKALHFQAKLLMHPDTRASQIAMPPSA